MFCRNSSACTTCSSRSSTDSSSCDAKAHKKRGAGCCNSSTRSVTPVSTKPRTCDDKGATATKRDKPRKPWDPDLFPSTGSDVELASPAMGLSAGLIVPITVDPPINDAGEFVHDPTASSAGVLSPIDTDASTPSTSNIEWDSLSEYHGGDDAMSLSR